MTASDFLRDVFGASSDNPIFVCSLRNADAPETEMPRQTITRNPHAIETFVRECDRANRGLFFCVSTLDPNTSTRSKETISELTGLHADLDFKSIDADPNTIEQALREIALPPSKVVHSGNGLQPYWHFKEALPATPENKGMVETLLRKLADHLAGDPAVCEVARLMRLPGSHNTKFGAWKEVKVIDERPCRYDPIEIEEWLSEATPILHRKPASKDGNGSGSGNPFLAQASTKSAIDVEARLADMIYLGPGGGGNAHDTLLRCTAAMLGRGEDIDAVVTEAFAALRKAAEKTAARFDAAKEEHTIREMCETWIKKHPDIKGTKQSISTPLIKSSAEFIAGFVPPDYIVDGLLQQGFLYSLTGATGAGKTAITLRLAASTALGVIFAGRETKKLRVLYLAAENPEDVRMRWIALSQHMGFDPEAIDVYWIEGCFKISQMTGKLKEEAEKRGGEFGLVIVDTSPVFFEGDDENSRTQQGRHAEMLRGLIKVIPGKPCIIANCHPVKNAKEDNLIPAGGGSFINQVDGNLTAFKNDSTTTMHWQGKFRGPEFAPMYFLIKTVTHEELKDSKGKPLPTVICEWISDQAKEDIAAQKSADEDKVLALIDANPNASLATIAGAMGWKLFSGEPNKMKAGRCVKALIHTKLVKERRRGGYELTPEGKKTRP